MEEFIGNVSILRLFYYAVLTAVLCLLGKLVDHTGQYKYMYLACGAIVLLSSLWLLIGNAINYRLLAKEREEEARSKNLHAPESRESEPLNKSNHDDVNVKSTRTENNSSERETNI